MKSMYAISAGKRMPMKPEKLVAHKGKGSHRRYQHADGRTTEINFHSKEIRKGTQEKIFKQIGLK